MLEWYRYDTTGMTLSYLVYQLAKNPGVQQKLQEEVDQAYEDSQGEISFVSLFVKKFP